MVRYCNIASIQLKDACSQTIGKFVSVRPRVRAVAAVAAVAVMRSFIVGLRSRPRTMCLQGASAQLRLSGALGRTAIARAAMRRRHRSGRAACQSCMKAGSITSSSPAAWAKFFDAPTWPQHRSQICRAFLQAILNQRPMHERPPDP